MNTFPFNLPLLYGAPEASGTSGQTGGSSLLVMLVTFALIIGVFYFLVIRPQNKKQKDSQKMLQSLRKNDRVSTIGGIRGTIVAVKEDSVVIKVDDNVKMEFNKGAVSQVLERKEEFAEPAKETKE